MSLRVIASQRWLVLSRVVVSVNVEVGVEVKVDWTDDLDLDYVPLVTSLRGSQRRIP